MTEKTKPEQPTTKATTKDTKPKTSSKPKEVGGRDGPDPVRYGDWEKGGIAVDF